jgi:hypothetical protein
MIFKLAQAAEKSWHRLRGHDQLPKVILGVKFNDGTVVVRSQAQTAAARSRLGFSASFVGEALSGTPERPERSDASDLSVCSVCPGGSKYRPGPVLTISVAFTSY